MSQTRPESPQSLGEITRGLASDVQELVRGEIALARFELEQKFDRVSMAAAWSLGGAFLGFAGVILVLFGIAAALAHAMPDWAAFLIVGVGTVFGGVVVAKYGFEMFSATPLIPERTEANLKKDAHLLKEHT